MVSVRCAALAVLSGITLSITATPARAACDAPVPPPEVGAPLTARALIELSEIGVPDGSVSDAPAPVAVDPSGTRIAFVVVRGDLATNSYCHTLMVMDLAGGQPRVVARGGDFAPQSAVVRGLFANFGTPLTTTPAWSPDGRQIAWLLRDAGTTQAWVAAANGSGSHAATHATADVEDVSWEASGRLLFSTRPAKARVSAAIDREGQSGWLYDDRITPNAGPRPQIQAGLVPLEWFSVTPDGGAPESAAAPTAPAVTSPTGEQLTISRPSDLPYSEGRATRTSPGGVSQPCRADMCRGHILGLWWQPGSRIAWYLRREGWQRETSALYRWAPGHEPQRVLATTDVINFCKPAKQGLVCLREGSTMPRRVMLLDWRTHRMRTVYDPNPGFDRYRLGTVTRLRWRNDRGYEAWGDLVLPPNYRAGEKLPLIVTQYHSRGFLRGGTGNEYPVFLFAARGFAVLSLEEPDSVALRTPNWGNAKEANRVNSAGWADRWSIQSSIETGVRAAIATGAIDPARLGITGLSDGGTAVRFALIHSQLFAAAALSSCCMEPETPGTAGPAFAKMYLYWGAPVYGAPGDTFWKPVSITLNADSINTPLLMQLSDDEYSLALGAFEALRVRGKPVEMFVFPDEHHNKAQPLHRQAIFERNIDWFDFWLRGREDPNPVKHAQYARWEAMRAKR